MCNYTFASFGVIQVVQPGGRVWLPVLQAAQGSLALRPAEEGGRQYQWSRNLPLTNLTTLGGGSGGSPGQQLSCQQVPGQPPQLPQLPRHFCVGAISNQGTSGWRVVVHPALLVENVLPVPTMATLRGSNDSSEPIASAQVSILDLIRLSIEKQGQ